MNYELVILPRAVRVLDQLPPAEQERISRAIEALVGQPRPRNARKLKGREGWRLRVGRYRVLYRIDDHLRQILVVELGHRKDIYRGPSKCPAKPKSSLREPGDSLTLRRSRSHHG